MEQDEQVMSCVALAAVCCIEAIAKLVGDGKGGKGSGCPNIQLTQLIARKDSDAI